MALALTACGGTATEPDGTPDAAKKPLSALSSDLTGILAGDRASLVDRRQRGRFQPEAFSEYPRPQMVTQFFDAPDGKVLRIDGREGGSEFIMTPETLEQSRFNEIFPTRGFEAERSDLSEGTSGRRFIFLAWIGDIYEDLDDMYVIPDSLKESVGILEVSQYDDENALCYRSTTESAAFRDGSGLENEEISNFYESVAQENRAMLEQNGAECRVYSDKSGSQDEIFDHHEAYYTGDKIRYPMGNAGYVKMRILTLEEFNAAIAD